jgi:hypothetical protein
MRLSTDEGEAGDYELFYPEDLLDEHELRNLIGPERDVR